MGILTHDTLIIDQVTNLLSNDFAVSDADGRRIGRIHTEGSVIGRIVKGSRRLVVIDEDEAPLLRLRDTMNMGRDRMEITDATGQPLATLVKKITLMRSRFSVELDGVPLDLIGNMWGFDFTMTGPRGTLATVSRSWSGVGRALLGHSRYVVELSPDLAPRERQAVLGTVIALDLVRAKQDRNSAG